MGAPDGMTYSGNNIKMPSCLNQTEIDLNVDLNSAPVESAKLEDHAHCNTKGDSFFYFWKLLGYAGNGL